MQIKVELLTEEAFKEFGHVLGEPRLVPPDIVDEVSNVWLGFTDLMGIGVQVGKQVTYLKIHSNPDQYDKMEKHDTSAEAFIPLDGKSILLVAPWKGVAPWQDVDKPDMSHARAFLMDGSKGVLMHQGTWHAVPYKLTELATYLVLVDPAIIKNNDLHVTPVEPVDFIEAA
jgi:ureidoglycolate hydrolase